MKSKITEEMVVENLLSEWPIKERQDERQLKALVATLLNGEKRMVEFEKSIVPAEVIGRYVVVEHTFPMPGIPSAKHYAEPIGEYDNYLEAHKEFYLKAENAIKHSLEENDFKEILLVGEFKNQKLDFDYNGIPDVNTGIIMGCTLIKDIPELWETYVAKEPGDPKDSVTLKTKLYVELDMQTAKLKFEQSVLQGNALNVEFWKVDSAKDFAHKRQKNSGADDDLLVKKRKDTPMTTEQWVNDPLLSKRNGGSSQGKKMH